MATTSSPEESGTNIWSPDTTGVPVMNEAG